MQPTYVWVLIWHLLTWFVIWTFPWKVTALLVISKELLCESIWPDGMESQTEAWDQSCYTCPCLCAQNSTNLSFGHQKWHNGYIALQNVEDRKDHQSGRPNNRFRALERHESHRDMLVIHSKNCSGKGLVSPFRKSSKIYCNSFYFNVCHGSSFPFSTHIQKKWLENNGDPFTNVVECNFSRAPNSPNWSQNTAHRMLKQRNNFRNFIKCGSWMAMKGHERSWWLVLWDMNVLVLNAAALRNVLQHTCAAGSHSTSQTMMPCCSRNVMPNDFLFLSNVTFISYRLHMCFPLLSFRHRVCFICWLYNIVISNFSPSINLICSFSEFFSCRPSLQPQHCMRSAKAHAVKQLFLKSKAENQWTSCSKDSKDGTVTERTERNRWRYTWLSWTHNSFIKFIKFITEAEGLI